MQHPARLAFFAAVVIPALAAPRPAGAVQVLSFLLSGPGTIYASDWASGGTDVTWTASISGITGDLAPGDPFLKLELELQGENGPNSPGGLGLVFGSAPLGDEPWTRTFGFHAKAYYDPALAFLRWGDPSITGWVENFDWELSPGGVRATCFLGDREVGPFYGHVRSEVVPFDVQAIPEPSALALIGAAMAGVGALRVRRRR